MTREEQIKEAAAKYCATYGIGEAGVFDTVADFVEGAEWADQHPNWIPVEERKPQERGQVIQVIIMDYKKYSEELETIIAAINLPEHTRILVNGLMKAAKEQCKKGD